MTYPIWSPPTINALQLVFLQSKLSSNIFSYPFLFKKCQQKEFQFSTLNRGLSPFEKSYIATPNIKLFTTGLFSCLNYRQTSFFILFIMTQKRPTKTNSFFNLKSSVNPYGKIQLEEAKLVSYMSRLFTAPYFFFSRSSGTSAYWYMRTASFLSWFLDGCP